MNVRILILHDVNTITGSVDVDPFYGCFRLVQLSGVSFAEAGTGTGAGGERGNQSKITELLAERGCNDLCNSNASNSCESTSRCVDYFDAAPLCKQLVSPDVSSGNSQLQLQLQPPQPGSFVTPFLLVALFFSLILLPFKLHCSLLTISNQLQQQ